MQDVDIRPPLVAKNHLIEKEGKEGRHFKWHVLGDRSLALVLEVPDSRHPYEFTPAGS